jgi:hypothetical protein
MLQALEQVLPWEVYGPAFEPAFWPEMRLLERPIFTAGEDEAMWVALAGSGLASPACEAFPELERRGLLAPRNAAQWLKRCAGRLGG